MLIAYLILSAYFASFYIRDGITMGKDGGVFLIVNYRVVLSKFLWTWETNVHGFPLFFNLVSSPFYLFLSLFDVWGITVKAYIYWFLVFLLAFSGSFLLIKKALDIFSINNDVNYRIVAFLSSLIYVISPITITYRWGDTNSQVLSYAALPLLIYFSLSILFEQNISFLIVNAIVYSLITYLISFCFCNITILSNIVLPVLFFLIFNYKKVNWKSIILGIIIFALLFSPLIFSIILQGKLTVNILTEGISKEHKYIWLKAYETTITDYSILIFYPTKLWMGLYSYNKYYLQPGVLLLWTLFIGLSMIVSLHCKEKNVKKYAIFSFLLTSFSYSLTLLPKGIFSIFYLNLIYNFDFLWAFKTAFDKFNYLLQLSLLFLTTNYLILIAKITRRKYKLYLLLLSIYFITILIVGYPLFSGLAAYDYYGQTSKCNFPSDFLEFKSYMESILNEDKSAWVLYIPLAKGSWIKANWYYGLDYTIHLMGKNTGCQAKLSNITSKIFYLLSSPNLTENENLQIDLLKLLILGNYKYIVIRKDINLTAQENLWIGEKGIRNQIINFYALQKKYNFSEIKSFSTMYTLYVNPHVLGQIFLINDLEKYNFTKVIYEMINPTLYRAEINLTKPSMLGFAENYDPLWCAKVYENGKEIKITKAIPLYGAINGFWINKTGLLEIIIEYEPQRWFYVDLTVSAATLIACITYLIYDRASNRNKLIKNHLRMPR